MNPVGAAAPETLNAGVPFYGHASGQGIAENIKAPMLIQLAELDQRVNESWVDYEKDLKAVGVEYAMQYVSEVQSRVPQRLDGALRRGQRQARLGTNGRFLQEASGVSRDRPEAKLADGGQVTQTKKRWSGWPEDLASRHDGVGCGAVVLPLSELNPESAV